MPRPEKTQDVSAPYVYFSVGPASAMGSGRVGGSSYPSVVQLYYINFIAEAPSTVHDTKPRRR